MNMQCVGVQTEARGFVQILGDPGQLKRDAEVLLGIAERGLEATRFALDGARQRLLGRGRRGDGVVGSGLSAFRNTIVDTTTTTRPTIVKRNSPPRNLGSSPPSPSIEDLLYPAYAPGTMALDESIFRGELLEQKMPDVDDAKRC